MTRAVRKMLLVVAIVAALAGAGGTARADRICVEIGAASTPATQLQHSSSGSVVDGPICVPLP